MSGLLNVMLGLEDVFARQGGRGQLDSIKVPELFETSRQQLVQIEHEGGGNWWDPPRMDTAPETLYGYQSPAWSLERGHHLFPGAGPKGYIVTAEPQANGDAAEATMPAEQRILAPPADGECPLRRPMLDSAFM